MTINYINTGSSANAGNGDTLRLAFTKINANFSELVDQISVIEVGSTSTLTAGTYTFALSNTGTVTLNGEPFVSGGGATGATGPTGAGFSDLTSTSSNSISTGTLTFTVNQTQGVESAFMGGQYVLAYAGTLGNVQGGVYGQIYSYYDQTLILSSYEVLFGSGTTSSWYFELTGAKGINGTIGIDGATGPAGPTNTATTATLGGVIVGHNLAVTSEGTLSAITSVISDVAPADPVEGDQWWDSVLGRGFVYYDGLWIEMSPNTGAVGPAGPAVDLTTVTTDIIPSQDLTYDLGSTSNQWRSLYVGTGTIYIGGVALGVSSDNYVTVDGNPIITVNTSGNLTVQGNTNLVLGSVAISATAPDATTPGSQWFNTVEGRTYVATDGVWLDASPTQVPSPETYLDGLSIDGTTISKTNIDNTPILIDGGGADVKIQTLSSSVSSSWWSMYGDLDRNFTEEFGAGSVYDNLGNLYVVGTFQTEGPDNLLVIKYDSAGQVLWSKSYGQDSGDSTQIYGESIIFDSVSGNLFILTNQETSWWGIIEITTAGDIVRWFHGDVDVSIVAWDLTIDPNGNIYIMGNPGNTFAGPNNSVYYITKLDATTLDPVWAKYLDYGATVNEPRQGQGFGALEYSNGYIYATGGVGVSGEGTSTNVAYTIKLDAIDGTQQWAADALYISAGIESSGAVGMGLCLDDNDNVYITLTANVEVGVSLIVKYNSSGVFQWSQQLMLYQGGGDVDINYYNGYLYATGVVYSGLPDGPTSDGAPGWIHWAKVNATTGDIVYQQKFGNASNLPLTDVWRFYGHDLGNIYNNRLSISAFVYESTTTTATVAANMITLQLPLTYVTTGTYGQYEITDFDAGNGTYFTTTNNLVQGLPIEVTDYIDFVGSEIFTYGSTSTVVVDNTLTFYTNLIGEIETGTVVTTWTFGNNNIVLPPGGDIVDSDGNSVLDGNSSGGVSNGWQLTSSTAVVSLGSDGVLTLPNGATIFDNDGPGGGWLSFAPANAGLGQALVIYPTAALDGNHIHLTADGGETDLYLGDDNQYVKVDHSGTIVIGTLGTNTSTWTFGTDGVLTLSTASTILGNSEDPNVYIETVTTGTVNTWTFAADGELTAPGHIVPNADLTYDLGSTSSRWHSLYVGTGSVYLGDLKLSSQTDAQGNSLLGIGGASQSYFWEGGITADPTLWSYSISKFTPNWNVSSGFSSGEIPEDVSAGLIFESDTSVTNWVAGGFNGVNPLDPPGLNWNNRSWLTTSSYNIHLKTLDGFTTLHDNQWTFGTDGSLTFPDATVQTTAWTGIAATATTSSTAASVGYIGMPQNSTGTNYELVIGDMGKHVYVTSTSTVTVPSYTSVDFPIGTAIAVVAGTGASVSIAITTDTMYLAGTGTTGTRTLAAFGMATLVKVAQSTWFISGVGLT